MVQCSPPMAEVQTSHCGTVQLQAGQLDELITRELVVSLLNHIRSFSDWAQVTGTHRSCGVHGCACWCEGGQATSGAGGLTAHARGHLLGGLRQAHAGMEVGPGAAALTAAQDRPLQKAGAQPAAIPVCAACPGARPCS